MHSYIHTQLAFVSNVIMSFLLRIICILPRKSHQTIHHIANDNAAGVSMLSLSLTLYYRSGASYILDWYGHCVRLTVNKVGGSRGMLQEKFNIIF